MLGTLRPKVVAHVVLLLIITAKDANLLDIAVQEAPQNSILLLLK